MLPWEPFPFRMYHLLKWGFPDGSVVKNLPVRQATRVQSLCWKDLLEKEMATHFSVLAWKIPWTEEPGRLQSMGSQRVGHDWLHFHFHFRENVTKRNKWTIFYPSVMKYNLCLLHIPWGFPDGASGKGSTSQHMRNKRHVFSPWVGTIPWRRKWQPTPVLFPVESHGQGFSKLGEL